jgi:hypothetical protein
MRPVIVARLSSKRTVALLKAITLEDLLIPCECLAAPLYVDLGSTA